MPPQILHIVKTAFEHTSLLLSEKEGQEIRDFIVTQINCSFESYVRNIIHMHPSNVHAYLAGQKRISLENLRKILSGTKFEVSECTLQLTISKNAGSDAETAPSVNLDEVLLHHELEEIVSIPDQEQSTLANHRAKQRTLLDSLLSETQDES